MALARMNRGDPRKMSGRYLAAVIVIAIIAGTPNPSRAKDFVASFYDMSATKFSLKAVASKDAVRIYAICKAVWFAEKMKAQHLALSNPIYSEPKDDPNFPIQIPPDWIALDTTAYLTEPNPSGNPMVSVAEKAVVCRRIWDWYR